MVSLFRALTVLHILIAMAGFALWYESSRIISRCFPVAVVHPGEQLTPPPVPYAGAEPSRHTEARVWYAPLPGRYITH